MTGIAVTSIHMASGDVATRVAHLDWEAAADALSARGYAVLKSVLTPTECREMQGWYTDPERFRSRVIMSRHGFGEGEYQYFAYPLPPLVRVLREAGYPPLARVANDWNRRLGLADSFPAEIEEFTALCHARGQHRPTPLMLRYGSGDYNRLHQDLYGDLHFPIQMVALLSEPERDFEGGEFVLTEQKPRSQTRVEVVPLQQGDICVFAVNTHPARGVKGYYKAGMRHGVSTVRRGERFTLGIIFHDAK